VRASASGVLSKALPKEKARLEDEFFTVKGIGSLDYAQLIKLMVSELCSR
jgi:hypothetical protein